MADKTKPPPAPDSAQEAPVQDPWDQVAGGGDVSGPTQEKRGKSPAFIAQQFQKGVSGNPGGRPKGGGKRAVSVVAQLRKILSQTTTLKAKDGSKVVMTNAELVAKSLVKMAVKDGKYQHIKEILDRVDGTLVNRLRIEGALDHMLDIARGVLEQDQYRKLCLALADAEELGGGVAAGAADASGTEDSPPAVH